MTMTMTIEWLARIGEMALGLRNADAVENVRVDLEDRASALRRADAVAERVARPAGADRRSA